MLSLYSWEFRMYEPGSPSYNGVIVGQQLPSLLLSVAIDEEVELLWKGSFVLPAQGCL